jgi:DNA-binding response OmpR family regulator
MGSRPAEILLVENDVELAEMVGRYLGEALPVKVTTVGSAAEALREELTCRHDLVVVSLDLAEGETLEMIRQLRVSNRCPLILTANAPDAGELIEAIHLGVVEVLVKPFALENLSGVVRRAIRGAVRRRRLERRYRRLRRLTGRVLRERRELKERTDLICQDLVHAYRGLAERVAQTGILTHQ